MKETLNVSINGIRFIVNSDAYQVLRAYLDKIESVYSKEQEGAEIIADIEARVSELLLSMQNDRVKVITEEMAKEVVTCLGEPEKGETETAEPTKKTDERFEKRLYRNGDGAILGGVLNGLATYFKVDVVVFRILFVLIFVLGCWLNGSIVAVLFISYLVMWIIVPRARTVRQKMEMKGSPVTASSIESSIREEMNSVARDPRNTRAASLFTGILYVIGRIVKAFLMFIAAIAGVGILFAMLGVLVAMFVMFAYLPTMELFFASNPYVIIPVIALSVLIPLVFVAYVIFKVLFNIRWGKGFVITLASLWFVSWALLAVLAFNEFSGDRSTYSDVQTTEVKSAASVLYINNVAAPLGRGRGDIFQHIEQEIKEDVTLPDSMYRIVVEKSAEGGTQNSAKELAESIDYKITVVSDSIVMMDPRVMINRLKRSLTRQSVKVTVYHSKNGKVVVATDNDGEEPKDEIVEDIVDTIY